MTDRGVVEGTGTHELKCVPPFFEAVLDGSKPFEARKHDRPFAEGDTLRLREWDGAGYTGRECERTISYVLVGGEFGIERGYVVLGLSVPLVEGTGSVVRAGEIEDLLAPDAEDEDEEPLWSIWIVLGGAE